MVLELLDALIFEHGAFEADIMPPVPKNPGPENRELRAQIGAKLFSGHYETEL